MREVCYEHYLLRRSLLFSVFTCLFCILGLGGLSEANAEIRYGEGMTWNLDANGQLTIDGTGILEAYDYYLGSANQVHRTRKPELYPWYEKRHDITKVVIGNKIKGIGSHAFFGEDNLKEIILSENTEFINVHAFQGCVSLKEIHLPDNVATIETGAFSDCTNLQAINIPAKVTKIGMFAFDNCTSLKEIAIPGGIESITDCAFKNCSNLQIVRLAEGVKSIEGDAFKGCRAISSIYVPKSITLIRGKAFDEGLSFDVYYAGTEEEWVRNVTDKANWHGKSWISMHYNE